MSIHVQAIAPIAIGIVNGIIRSPRTIRRPRNCRSSKNASPVPRIIWSACEVSVKMNVFASARRKMSSSRTARRLVNPVNSAMGLAVVALLTVNQSAMAKG